MQTPTSGEVLAQADAADAVAERRHSHRAVSRRVQCHEPESKDWFDNTLHVGDCVYLPYGLDAEAEDVDEDTCNACGQCAKGLLIECLGCLGQWHMTCVGLAETPEVWFCDGCTAGLEPTRPLNSYALKYLFGPTGDAALLYLARIVEIEEGGQWVHLEHYCLPREAEGAVAPGTGGWHKREVLLTTSKHRPMLTREVRDCLLHKARVVPRAELPLHDDCDDVFVCDFTYDVVLQTLTANPKTAGTKLVEEDEGTSSHGSPRGHGRGRGRGRGRTSRRRSGSSSSGSPAEGRTAGRGRGTGRGRARGRGGAAGRGLGGAGALEEGTAPTRGRGRAGGSGAAAGRGRAPWRGGGWAGRGRGLPRAPEASGGTAIHGLGPAPVAPPVPVPVPVPVPLQVPVQMVVPVPVPMAVPMLAPVAPPGQSNARGDRAGKRRADTAPPGPSTPRQRTEDPEGAPPGQPTSAVHAMPAGGQPAQRDKTTPAMDARQVLPALAAGTGAGTRAADRVVPAATPPAERGHKPAPAPAVAHVSAVETAVAVAADIARPPVAAPAKPPVQGRTGADTRALRPRLPDLPPLPQLLAVSSPPSPPPLPPHAAEASKHATAAPTHATAALPSREAPPVAEQPARCSGEAGVSAGAATAPPPRVPSTSPSDPVTSAGVAGTTPPPHLCDAPSRQPEALVKLEAPPAMERGGSAYRGIDLCDSDDDKQVEDPAPAAAPPLPPQCTRAQQAAGTLCGLVGLLTPLPLLVDAGQRGSVQGLVGLLQAAVDASRGGAALPPAVAAGAAAATAAAAAAAVATTSQWPTHMAMAILGIVTQLQTLSAPAFSEDLQLEVQGLVLSLARAVKRALGCALP